MRNERQQEQPPGVFFDIVGVVVALRDKIPHNGRSEPADDMREYPGQIVQTRWSRVMAAMAMSFS